VLAYLRSGGVSWVALISRGGGSGEGWGVFLRGDDGGQRGVGGGGVIHAKERKGGGEEKRPNRGVCLGINQEKVKD